MTDTGQLVEFVRARLDEDEQIARAAMDASADGVHMRLRPQRWRLSDTEGVWSVPDGVQVLAGPYGMDDEVGRHVVAHEPARVLAGTAAKRAVLEHADVARREAETYRGMYRVGCANGANLTTHVQSAQQWDSIAEVREEMLCLLASEWSGHPDWQERWNRL